MAKFHGIASTAAGALKGTGFCANNNINEFLRPTLQLLAIVSKVDIVSPWIGLSSVHSKLIHNFTKFI